MTRKVMPARSYLSQSELPVTFGLGPNPPPIESIDVTWPGGGRQKVTAWKLDATTVVSEER